MQDKILSQGAEAVIFLKNEIVIKQRIKKGYRISQIDSRLRIQRTRKEAKLLYKCASIIFVPKIISFNEEKNSIYLEYIKGKKLSDCLDKIKNFNPICEQIGISIAKMHDAGIIHGDLTTSNMILKENKVFIIDFGLGFESKNVEHKAVDLHVLKEALYAKHYKNAQKLFSSMLEGYNSSKNYKEVINRLKKVETRGRYKKQF